MHALTLLKNDHRLVEALFEELLATKLKAKKQTLIKTIIKELAVHANIEEQVFYPRVREVVRDAEDEVLEALEEHHIVKWLLAELEKMSPAEERFDAKVKVLCENVTHHVREEETKLFPMVRDHMERRELERLGRALESAKDVAPQRPQPRAPDTPTPRRGAAGRMTKIGGRTPRTTKELLNETRSSRRRRAR